MDSAFLPQGYEVPKGSSDYMKLKQGANKFRILSAPILGYEYWTEARKPVRARELWRTIPADADISKGWKPKHFWAFVVWNFQDKKLQILEITQSTIQAALTELIRNSDWGDPRHYNITVTRKGEQMDTEYTVVPSPKTAVPDELQRMYDEAKINLKALYEGGNPFDASERQGDLDAPDFPTNSAKAPADNTADEINPYDIPF